MEIFNAIGLKFPKGKTINDLAQNAEKLGEASVSTRPDCVIYGHCWRIGAGLEVWTILYESGDGEVFYADCRPGFRAKFTLNIEVWSLYEDEEEGEAAIAGKIEDFSTRVFFQLQNLTEVSPKNFEREVLRVGLGGLALRAEVADEVEDFLWEPLHETDGNADMEETYWRLCGRVLDFDTVRNTYSKKGLYWIHLELKHFNLEILVNQKDLRGAGALRVGKFITADIWLQGHVVSQSTYHSNYEGIDWSSQTADFWKSFKRQN